MNTQSLRFRMTTWYAGLLTVSLVVFCACVFLGLRNYLNDGLRANLAEQARSIGEKLLIDVNEKGEQYVIAETNEHYAPEINGRFIRITRSDDSVWAVAQAQWAARKTARIGLAAWPSTCRE